MGFTEIGRAYNVSEATVYRRIKQIGVFVRRLALPGETPTQWHHDTRKDREFPAAVKKRRFQEEHGICQWCHEIIGDGVSYRDRGVNSEVCYHHVTMCCLEGDNTPSNCMVLHKACHGGSRGVPLNAELHKGMKLANPGYKKPCFVCSRCDKPGARSAEGVCAQCTKNLRREENVQRCVALLEEGLPVRDIAIYLKLGEPTVEKYLGARKPKQMFGSLRYQTTQSLTPEVRAQIVTELMNYSAREIALKYGTTHTTVLRLAKQAQLK